MKEPDKDVRYKVAEVCRLADVQPYVLKYWESEFPILAPERHGPGPRTYTARELDVIERIKHLLYDEGYTIAGAKKRLEADLKEIPPEEAALVLTPPAPQPDASTARVRKPKSKSQSAEPPLVFEEVVSDPATNPVARPVEKPAAQPETEPEEALEESPRVDRPSPPMAQSLDPRLARVAAELKEILKILSSDPT